MVFCYTPMSCTCIVWVCPVLPSTSADVTSPPPRVQINWTLKTQALTNMQVQWRPKSAGKWHPFQWEAILQCPTAEGHRAVPPSEQNWRLPACVAGGPS